MRWSFRWCFIGGPGAAHESARECAAIAAALACVAASAQSTFRGDAAHHGIYRGDAPRQFHRVKWTFPTGDRIVSSPVYRDGTIYFGSDDGNVYAVNAADGRQRWKRRTGGPVASTPALDGDMLYVASYDGKLYALDARTGVPKWRFHGGEDPAIHNQVGFQSSPAIVDGTVYTGCRDSHLYAIDAATGNEKWRFDANGSWVNSSPAVVDGKVLFATSDSSLYLVADANTGKVITREQGNALMFSSPAVAGDVVFIGVLNGSLEARDLASGNLLWTFETDAAKRNAGWALTAERRFNAPMLFWSTWREAPLVATERQFDVGSIFSSPLVVDGVVFFGSSDGNLYAIE